MNLGDSTFIKTEQTRLPEYCSVDVWCRFLETAHDLGEDAERPRLSLSNSSTYQGGGKRRAVFACAAPPVLPESRGTFWPDSFDICHHHYSWGSRP